MIQSVVYVLTAFALVLFIIFLLRELLGSLRAGVHTSAPFGEPTNDQHDGAAVSPLDPDLQSCLNAKREVVK